MVFEAVVVEVLNRYLGEYVENLDSSQLKIGIWGGDVVLKDLTLKGTALNDLNLPIKVTWGQLGKLVLKIPWKNLYSAPVVVDIEDLFVLVSPESEVVYIPEREERWAQEAKQAELKRVEEAKKLAAEKDAVNKDDTFVEKLVTQIIKNVQVRVERIHLRYEDRSTRPGENGAFCVGATMNQLSVQTTDENGVPCFATDVVRFIYKKLTLDGLGLYWNPSGELLSELLPAQRKDRFRNDIPRPDWLPPGYCYVFGPISSSAQLVLNPKPELDGSNYSIPKLVLDITMNEFSVALNRRQFQDMMLLVENMDRLSKGRSYRRFRPDLKSYRGHYSEWWDFAIKGVLVDIQRRKSDWDWTHMLLHRQRCREYQKLYARLLAPKPPLDVVAQARQLEAELDVLNLVLVRERAALDAQRLAKAEETARSSKGWFSGWFSSAPTEEEQFSANIAKKIETAMTPEEKSKLYEAIGYQENDAPMQYPITFIATRMRFLLKAAVVSVLDDDLLVVCAKLTNFGLELDQRPAASALKATVSFGDFSVVGLKQLEGVAQLVSSQSLGNESLVDVTYETNPLDGHCDQLIHVEARPLTIIYNHETITRLKEIFTSADTQGINQVKARTAASLPSFKQMSNMGLQFAVERRSRLDLQIHVPASTILVPHTGVYLPDRPMLVVKLGQLSVETEEQKAISDVYVRKLHNDNSTDEEIFSSILSESYTTFHCRLTGIQILMRLEKEEWEASLKEKEVTQLHLLQPTDVSVVIKKSLVTDDARIPKMKVEGVLPSICIHVSEERMLALAGLVFSMPSPQSDVKEETQSKSSSMWSLASLGSMMEQKRKEVSTPVNQLKDVPLVQGTDLICNFQMNEFIVNVSKSTGQFLRLAVVQLTINMEQKTLETKLGVQLSNLSLIQIHSGENIPILASISESSDHRLVSLDVISCERNSPELFTTKDGILTSVQLTLSQSKLVLHKDALITLIDFANSLQAQVDQVKLAHGLEVALPSPEPRGLHRKLSLILEEENEMPKRKKILMKRKSGKSSRAEVIDLKAVVVVEGVCVEVRGEIPIAKLSVEGIELGVKSKRSSMSYALSLKGLLVHDLDPKTAYSMAIISPGKQTIHADITMYNKEFLESQGDFEVDMRVEASLGQLRIVYLQRFITQLVEFGNSFQKAKETVIEASVAAAERAKINVKKAYEDATRLALSVNIAAPLIVVPKNNTSTDALVIDLGVVTINNSFSNLPTCSQGTPLLDVIKLDLHELKLGRTSVNPSNLEVTVELPLVEPITFDLQVKRNLSAAWYHEIPDLDISSRLGSVMLALDQMDYLFILNVLEENIAKGGADHTGDKVEVVQPSDREASAVAPAVSTANMFTFSLDSIIISLYSGGLSSISPNNISQARKHALARFVLQTLALKGKTLSDGSITTSIRLVNCLLEDRREMKGSRLKTLLERKIDADEEKSMIDITFTQKDLQQFADVRVCSFSLVISVDFLMKVAAFFAVTNEGEKPQREKLGNSRRKQNKARALEPTSPSPVDRSFTLDLRVEKPDIVLVSDMKEIDTDAMVFHTEVILKFRLVGQKQVINGMLKDLQLYTCCFNPSKRRSTMKQILKPVTVSIAGSTPDGKGLQLDLTCTSIIIAVTPSTIQLLNLCNTTLKSSEDSNDDKDKERDCSTVWSQKEFKEEDYWFLMPEEAEEALELYLAEPLPEKELDELCMISVPTILITVDAGVGKHTVPMILLEMGLSVEAKNWSNRLRMDAYLDLGMQYYNTIRSAWEPFIEPVEIQMGQKREFKPWQLSCQVTMNNVEEEDVRIEDMTPAMSVTLSAKETLEITVTRSSLDVMTQLGEMFANAVAAAPAPSAASSLSAATSYVFCNDSGYDLVLLLNASHLLLEMKNDTPGELTVSRGEQVELKLPIDMHDSAPRHISYTPKSPSSELPGHFLILKVNNLEGTTLKIPLEGATKRLYPIPQPRGSPPQGGPWAVVAEIAAGTTATTVTLRSAVQIHNHFSVPINVYFMMNRGNEVELVGTVDPFGFLNIPPSSIYTATAELFFSVPGYSLSIVPFVWRDIQKEMKKHLKLQCDPKKKEDVDPFFIQAVGEMEQIFFEHTTRHTLASMSYNIHLMPTLVLENGLPTDLTAVAQGTLTEVHIRPGARVDIPHANPGMSSITFRIDNYLDKCWSCKMHIPASPPEFSVLTFESFDSEAMVALNLGVHCTVIRESINFAIYCPFWMINKTAKQLSYVLDDSPQVFYHPADFHEPVMLSPHFRKFLGKKKGQVKVEQGSWSDKFSLDVAGSSGTVECCDKSGSPIMLSINIKLTHNSLTKMIVLTPAHVVVNKSPMVLEVQELGSTEWIKVPASGCAPLWPSHRQESQLLVRVLGTTEITPAFFFHSTSSCLLQLNNKYGGIYTDIQTTAGGIYIFLNFYEPGLAPVLLLNHTDKPAKFYEKGVKSQIILPPGHSLLYAWKQPSIESALIWMSDSKEVTFSLREDTAGEIKKEVWYVCFLDGLQRVLLLTNEERVAKQSTVSFEKPLSEICLNLHGVGLSLVNNRPPKAIELLYMGLVSSGVTWEARKMSGRRFKTMPLQESALIEKAYNTYTANEELGRTSDPIVVIDNKLQVNLETLELLAPSKKCLRRTFEPGLWISMTQTADTTMLHGKINRLQLDNQTPGAFFPVILAPVPPPKTVAADFGPKPFMEISILKKASHYSSVQQYKYFKALIQEFHIKLDVGFVNLLLSFFDAENTPVGVASRRFIKDVQLSQQPLLTHIAALSTQEHKDFYDLLHISPLKIHLSFSMAGNMENRNLPAAFSLLLQSVGFTLTDIQDAVFRLSYLERKNIFLTQSQLISEATTHYSGQALRQVYVILLGLDVIGNPFGLVTGIGEGVEALFYEPFQGIIQGPSEFAEGLSLGVQSLFGHTVGGAAGAFGRITGTLGKGLAALTLDSKYQQERMEQMRRPDNLPASMAQGGRGLVMGVVQGVTGVVTKPYTGAKEEGVGGFFKGVGMGVVGLVTRPASGVVDLASTSLNAVKRATEHGKEASRLRAPRLLRGVILTPYGQLESEGSALLAELDSRRYAATDEYQFHFKLPNRDVLILTDQRLIIATMSDVFGTWQVNLTVRWNELASAPAANPKGVVLTLQKKKTAGLFSSGKEQKIIPMNNPIEQKFLLDKMAELCFNAADSR